MQQQLQFKLPFSISNTPAGCMPTSMYQRYNVYIEINLNENLRKNVLYVYTYITYTYIL